MSGSASIVWALPFTSRVMRAMGACLPGVAFHEGGSQRLRAGSAGHGVSTVTGTGPKGSPSASPWKHPCGDDRSTGRSALLHRRNRATGDLHLDGVERAAAGGIEGFPI